MLMHVTRQVLGHVWPRLYPKLALQEVTMQRSQSCERKQCHSLAADQHTRRPTPSSDIHLR